MKPKSPAFQFYPDDFIGGTCDLSAEEVGTYIRLLCYQWSRESIPVDDIPKLTRIAGSNVTLDVLRKFPDGKNAKLESVRNNLNKYKTTCVENGKKGGNPNFVKGKSNPYYQEDNQNDNPIDNQKDNPRLCSKDNPTDNPEISSLTLSLTPTLTSTITSNPKAKGTLEEFKAYAVSQDLPENDGEFMFNKLEGNGWMNGKSPVKDWKAVVRTWKSGEWLPSLQEKKRNAANHIKPRQLSKYDIL